MYEKNVECNRLGSLIYPPTPRAQPTSFKYFRIDFHKKLFMTGEVVY